MHDGRQRVRGTPLDKAWVSGGVSLLVCAIIATAGFGYLDAALSERSADARLALEQEVAGRVQSIQNLLLKVQAPLSTLADILVVNRGAFPDFDAFARHLLWANPGVAGLFLCPEGVVRVAVPLAGNEAALGHELLKDPQRRVEVEEAISTGATVLAGPVDMRQGGVGLFARKPVFWTEDGQRRFWGLVVALIRWETVRESPEFRSLEQGGMAFRLERRLGSDPGPVVIERSDADVLANLSVSRSLIIPGGEWLLTISPPKDPDAGLFRYGALLVVFCSVVGGGVVLLVLRGRARIVAQSFELEQANDELEKRLFERGLLIKEVHHRVKNNLQIIISLLDLQSSGVENEEFESLAGACKDRIRAIALAHEQVYRRDNLASIGVRNYFEGLTGNVLRGFAGPAGTVHCVVRSDIPDIALGKAVYLGLIVTELVTNALKYAFSGVENPAIEVVFERGPEGTALVSVRDNGRGFPDGRCPESASSLGLVLVRNLASQLGGSMRCGNHGGALVEVSMRLREPDEAPGN